MNTAEKLKTVLQEWAEYELPVLYERDFDEQLLGEGQILSIIGARRTGKTYLCYQLIQSLRKKYPHNNIIYINLEDERLYPLNGNELTTLWDVCLELFSIDVKKNVYLFVDEIQNCEQWSRWARRITDQNKNIRLIITGSSSKLLSREIATELRGRTRTFHVFPLSFSEYVRAKHGSIGKNILHSKQRGTIKRHFNTYLKRGGFPAIVDVSKPEEILKEYYNVMFYRDIVERYSVANIKLLEDYLTLLIDQVALLHSISSTAKKLNDFGYSFSKNTLSNFSKYAEDAFLIFEMKKYSYKIKEQLRAPKKVYAIDHGLVQAVRFAFSEGYGRMMENIAYLALKRTGKEVYYHQHMKECDFITVDRGTVVDAIQVTKHLHDATTRAREIAGLLEALSHHRLHEGTILTDDEYETVHEGKYTIHVVPLWYWLLDRGDDHAVHV